MVTPDGTLLLAGNFTLDASTTPKSITWIDSMGADQGKQLPASYQLEGDRFVFIAGDEGCDRPKEFRTQKGETMRTFIRSPSWRCRISTINQSPAGRRIALSLAGEDGCQP